jgi:hypothetical protein
MIEYKPEELSPGRFTAHWECQDCGAAFVPATRLTAAYRESKYKLEFGPPPREYRPLIKGRRIQAAFHSKEDGTMLFVYRDQETGEIVSQVRVRHDGTEEEIG